MPAARVPAPMVACIDTAMLSTGISRKTGLPLTTEVVKKGLYCFLLYANSSGHFMSVQDYAKYSWNLRWQKKWQLLCLLQGRTMQATLGS